MDGLTAIGSRIAEINAQLARLSAPSVTTATTSTTTSATTRAATTATSRAAATSSSTPSTLSFDDVLAGAVRTSAAGTSTTSRAQTASAGAAAQASTTHAGTARTGSTGRLTSSGAPVELARYGNGRIPAAALEPMGGGHRLWKPAAESFQRMQAAARRDGVHIGVTDSYRSYAEQVDVARRKGLHSQGGLAAKPGTSEHGWGKSLDLRLGTTAQRWMRAHADEYGFTENVSREPWHWTYTAT